MDEENRADHRMTMRNMCRQGVQKEPEVHQVTKQKAAGAGSNLGLGESGTDRRGKRETNEV